MCRLFSWFCKVEPPPIIPPSGGSIGWVNVFITQNNKLRISCHPKLTRGEALRCRTRSPLGTYVKTIEIGEM